jgi:hypothetical protein
MGRNKNDDMVCDVCGCITGHMTLKKPPERPADECQRCYWTRELTVDGLKVERDAAIARADSLDRGISEVECALVLAERARDELGIQLAACQERLRLAMAVVEAARAVFKSLRANWRYFELERTIIRFDAVPGDVLSKRTADDNVRDAIKSLRAGGMSPLAIVAHLEAHGIKTGCVMNGGAALDAVPGDALPHPTRHLEASGIDTANVRWVGPDGEVER